MIGGVPCLAPLGTLTTLSKAVDVGCGTGVATVQIAGLLPSATVYGLDISPVPEAVRKMAPNNTSWVQGNILGVDDTESSSNSESAKGNKIIGGSKSADGLAIRDIFTPGGLDYIFGRMLFLGISDWARYFSINSRSLRSGGIVEHQDLDWKFYRVGTNECLSDNWEWHKSVVAAAENGGLSTRAGSEAAKYMKLAGLEVVNVRTFEFSFVPSAKTPNSQAMGRYVQAKLIPQYPELLRKMLGAQGITSGELERLTNECLRDIQSEEGLHQKYTVTIGRKP